MGGEFMFKSGFLLQTDDQLRAAMFNKSDVIATQEKDIIDFGGIIQGINDYVVTINNSYYVKEVCTFRIR
jgi:hypothetical protein